MKHNCSKKWNTFDLLCLLLEGFDHHINAQLRSVSTSLPSLKIVSHKI